MSKLTILITQWIRYIPFRFWFCTLINPVFISPAEQTLFVAVIVGPLWHTFMSSLGVYVRSSIEGTEDPYDDRYDSDGAEKSLDSFVIQVVDH